MVNCKNVLRVVTRHILKTLSRQVSRHNTSGIAMKMRNLLSMLQNAFQSVLIM